MSSDFLDLMKYGYNDIVNVLLKYEKLIGIKGTIYSHWTQCAHMLSLACNLHRLS